MWDTHRVVPFVVPNQQERKASLGSLAGEKWRVKKCIIGLYPFFRGIKKPVKDDWLDQFEQDGQTYQVYTSINKNYIDKKKHIIFLGLYEASISKQEFAQLKKRCKAFFYGCKVKKYLLPPFPKQKMGQITDQQGNKYYDGVLLNRHFSQKLPKNAFNLLVITDLLVYNPKNLQLPKFETQEDKNKFLITQNWVHGLASLKDRTGVISLGKIDKSIKQHEWSSRKVFLQKVVQHQIAHTFRIKHCIFFQCLMNGSNHFQQAYNKFFQLCPVCLRKLQHNIGFDILQRYKELSNFDKWFEEPIAAIQKSLALQK